MGLTLVTGGAGFVGRPLVARLRARGERVRVLDLSEGEGDWIAASIEDEAAVARAMEGVDSVFHLAGDARLWARDETTFERVNHQGARNVFAAARRAGVRRLVHCSSLTTLVGKSTPVGRSGADESRALPVAEMLGPYPASKRRAEMALDEAVAAGLDAVTALPTEPLGPGDETLTPPTRMIVDFLNGAIPASIDCVLNFTPVDSLAEGFIAARDRGRRGARYLLGGENVTMRRLLGALERLSGRRMPKARAPYPVALMAGAIDTALIARVIGKPPKAPLTGVRLAGRQVEFSSEKAARELGWRAAPFEPALAETIRWLTERGFVR